MLDAFCGFHTNRTPTKRAGTFFAVLPSPLSMTKIKNKVIGREAVCKQLNLPAFILRAKLHRNPNYRTPYRVCDAEIVSPSVTLKYFIY